MHALERARLEDRVARWERNEASLRATVVRYLGGPPRFNETPQMMASLGTFRSWCEQSGVRYCPAQPATVAQFVLEHASRGVKGIADIVATIADTHAALGIANPAATWMVAAAMERVGGVAPPRSWPKDLKAQFALLPLNLKYFVAEHDRQREKALRRAQNEAARARRALAAMQAVAPINPQRQEM